MSVTTLLNAMSALLYLGDAIRSAEKREYTLASFETIMAIVYAVAAAN